MADSWLRSLHLEGLPRQDSFRAARQAIQEACGNQTLAGDPCPMEPARLAAQVQPTPLGLAAAAGRATFYLKDGEKVIPLHVGMNSIGRLPDNDVIIRDECVSRRHCAIVIHTDSRCELHDVASKNGTILNDTKIPAPAQLKPGDRITLCNRHFTFHVGELAANSPQTVDQG